MSACRCLKQPATSRLPPAPLVTVSAADPLATRATVLSGDLVLEQVRVSGLVWGPQLQPAMDADPAAVANACLAFQSESKSIAPFDITSSIPYLQHDESPSLDPLVPSPNPMRNSGAKLRMPMAFASKLLSAVASRAGPIPSLPGVLPSGPPPHDTNL